MCYNVYIRLEGFYMTQTHTTTVNVRVDEYVKRNVEVLKEGS